MIRLTSLRSCPWSRRRTPRSKVLDAVSVPLLPFHLKKLKWEGLEYRRKELRGMYPGQHTSMLFLQAVRYTSILKFFKNRQTEVWEEKR